MAGTRPFDDDRWPDQENFACCFICGKKVDPKDPRRGSYTGNAAACEPLPIHLPCLDGRHIWEIRIAFMTALNQMGDANAKRSLEAARCATAPAGGT